MEKVNEVAALNTYENIRDLVKDELDAVEELMLDQIQSKVALNREISSHIIGGGGKRLRPLTVLLTAKACGYEGPDHIRISAVLEFVHTATLLHDDVVDNSLRRRGKKTANAIWGNSASVLVGDFIYSKSFQVLSKIHDPVLMEILSSISNVIAEGELMQLMHRHNVNTTLDEYMHIIRCKTAKLFEAATHMSAKISQTNEDQIMAFIKYGLHLGTAFQLTDDLLDFTGNSEAMGKNIGDDLADGKTTLPLIYAMEHSDEDVKNDIKEIIKSGATDEISFIKDVILSTDALKYTHEQAKGEATKAIEQLSSIQPSKYKDGLIALVDFAISRNH